MDGRPKARLPIVFSTRAYGCIIKLPNRLAICLKLALCNCPIDFTVEFANSLGRKKEYTVSSDGNVSSVPTLPIRKDPEVRRSITKTTGCVWYLFEFLVAKRLKGSLVELDSRTEQSSGGLDNGVVNHCKGVRMNVI
jgi:hypothetical protein